ncbi:hypothetical protein DFH08DRAFT_832677 [Mycena albidolilacea]|uniref:F-box domain-containing protein n=1 Tax=Mycena albidolilacea TaxID=1033008 RepID=A0AAD7AVT4_9AGAR|nr:hypothetical protein DFH08DRAFT_832677 [Mycena albidolilacea]
MAPSTNGILKLDFQDLAEDVLIVILVECDVLGVLAVSRTSKFLRRVALTTAVWYPLVAKLAQRGLIDSRPDDGYFKTLSTEQLIGLVKRILHGPKTWTDTPFQSQSFSAPRPQTAARRAVSLFRKLLRRPPLDSLASGPLVEARRIVLHHPRPNAHVPSNRTTDSLKLLPGGKYLLFQNYLGCVECRSIFEDRRVWTHTPSMVSQKSQTEYNGSQSLVTHCKPIILDMAYNI